MRRQQREAQHLAPVVLQQVAHRAEVAQGLGHFLAVDIQERVVHPVAHVIAAMGAAALGNLVFVVRENQVAATAVDIDGLAKVGPDHGGALQVPARPAAPPGAVPARFIGRRGFPQHEIPGMALVIGHFHPRACQHIVQRAPRQLAVVRHGLHGEQHMPWDS